VHHARKGAGKERAGQALRGSSEFHAWGDSNLYLRRREEQLLLAIEHRAAPSRSGISLELRAQNDALALAVSDAPAALPNSAAPALDEQIQTALEDASGPLSVADLRRICRVRTSTLCDTLNELIASGRLRKAERGYQLIS